MSIVALAAPLISRSVLDDAYAQDLRDSVTEDHSVFAGLVESSIRTEDLRWLAPSEWQWFARWRQRQGGRLDGVLLGYLESLAHSRAARFGLRSLVLRDPATVRHAREVNADGEARDLGLRWLSGQAQTFPDELELARDALQIATEPAWYLLRELTSLDGLRGERIEGTLRAFADQREIGPEITSRWTRRGQGERPQSS